MLQLRKLILVLLIIATQSCCKRHYFESLEMDCYVAFPKNEKSDTISIMVIGYLPASNSNSNEITNNYSTCMGYNLDSEEFYEIHSSVFSDTVITMGMVLRVIVLNNYFDFKPLRHYKIVRFKKNRSEWGQSKIYRYTENYIYGEIIINDNTSK